MTRRIAVGLLNINEPDRTIVVLESLARLPDDRWAVELVLVDNGSDAKLLRPLQAWMDSHSWRFAKAHLMALPDNVGAAEGRNLILRHTSADRILFLDNDVILPEQDAWLDALWETMDARPEAGIVGPILVFADHADIVQAAGIGLTVTGRVGYLSRGAAVEQVPAEVTEVVASPSACWLVRREAQEEIGGFDRTFYPVQFEDVDFCVRLGQVGRRILCDGRARVRHVGNITTGNLKDHAFDRLTVRMSMRFKEKWADLLPRVATISEEEIYWGPIPRPAGLSKR